MGDINEACESLVEQGLAKKVSGNAIQFTGDPDMAKLAETERRYATAFHQRWLDRVAKEREAEKEFHDFVITY